MKTTKLFRLTCVLCLISAHGAFAQDKLPQLGKSPVRDIIKLMTLDEKALLVTGTGLRLNGSGPVIGEADGKVPGAAGNTMNLNRFGIPGTVLSDGPAGLRIEPFHKGDSTKSYYATAWPVGTLLASSWDTSLVKKVGVAFGNEIKEYGVDAILAPGMNIQRDPLNGRNFEYFSEDPYVTGYMAAAIVNGIQSNGVGTSVKHFAANNQETNRSSVNVILSQRALREIYLRGFEMVVKKSQPYTVMSSYNKINGTYTSESNDLLSKILRQEWGFKGIVMTDWYGGKDVAAQMKAGNDLLEPGSKRQKSDIVEAVNNGTLDLKTLDQNVERILNYILKTQSFKNYHYSDQPDLKAHAQIAREAGAAGMVLLKNQYNTLPVAKDKRVALFGNASYKTITGGTGSGEVNVAYVVPIIDGLSNTGIKVDETLQKYYTNYIAEDLKAHPKKKLTLGKPRVTPEPELNLSAITEAASNNDLAILTISRNAGEGADRSKQDFDLSDPEKKQLKSIADAFHALNKKLVVILNIGGVIETVSWRDHADAILLAWQPGNEAGNSIADILRGQVNPSGKLAQTFPLTYQDVPSSKNFPGTPAVKPEQVIYEEGVYVGYRYYNSFHVKTAYPFGFGLSYTTFAYSNLLLSSTIFKGQITASVTITNTGKTPGREVIQLYLSAPHRLLDKPSEELKAFAKTRVLKPGQSQKFTFALTARDLASFYTDQSSWAAEAGKYQVKVGASSEDINMVKAFSLFQPIIVQKVNKALVPQVTINELKNIKAN